MPYLSQNIRFLRDELGLNQSDFGALFDCSRDNIMSYERGSEPKLITLQKIAIYFHTTIDELYNTDLKSHCTLEGKDTENVHLIYTPNSTPNSKKKDLRVQITEDKQLLDNKSRVPVKVMNLEAAASISGVLAGTYTEELGVIHLPDTFLKRNHNYYAFKVKNESMHPTLYHGDHVIGAHIPTDRWDTLKDNYIYIISSKNDGIYIKRIKNRLLEQGFIRCRSDNRSFNSFSIPHSEVVSIFEVVCKISFNLPNEAKTLYEAISRLEDRMDDIETKYNPKP